MGGKLTEREYITSVVNGCLKNGIYAMVGDTAIDEFLLENLRVLKEYDGKGIVFIKPWENEDIIKKDKISRRNKCICSWCRYRRMWTCNIIYAWKNSVPKNIEDIKELKGIYKFTIYTKRYNDS